MDHKESICLLLFVLCWSIFFTQCLSTTANVLKQKQSCSNIYQGKWVFDQSYPLYDSLKCPYVQKQINCLMNGRTNRQYLKYRWQPNSCNLQRFNGLNFLRKMKGKKIMFIGDSVSDNHFQSLLCLLHVATGKSNVTSSGGVDTPISSITFKDYGVTVSMFLSHYLVDIESRRFGRVLNLDSLKNGDIWKKQDVLIFNTWLWWYRKGSKQPWDYIKTEGKIIKDMDRMTAFRKALTTWTKWVNMAVNPIKTKVFFQGISPMHYYGKEWNDPRATNCGKETRPSNSSSYGGVEPLASKVLKQVLTTTKKVSLLDITRLSQMRKDGHPSKYNVVGGMDCTHWCIGGVTDTWNQLLYSQLV